MKNSEKMEQVAKQAIELLKRHEGFSDIEYLDTEGNRTIGYGFKYNPDDLELNIIFANGRISRLQAELILKGFVWKCIADLQEIVGERNNQSELMDYPADNIVVFISMRYCLGRKGFLGFKNMILALPDSGWGGSWEEVKKEILDSKWARNPKTKARVKELTEMLRSE